MRSRSAVRAVSSSTRPSDAPSAASALGQARRGAARARRRTPRPPPRRAEAGTAAGIIATVPDAGCWPTAEQQRTRQREDDHRRVPHVRVRGPRSAVFRRAVHVHRVPESCGHDPRAARSRPGGAASRQGIGLRRIRVPRCARQYPPPFGGAQGGLDPHEHRPRGPSCSPRWSRSQMTAGITRHSSSGAHERAPDAEVAARERAPRRIRRTRWPMLPLTTSRKTNCSAAKIAEGDQRRGAVRRREERPREDVRDAPVDDEGDEPSSESRDRARPGLRKAEALPRPLLLGSGCGRQAHPNYSRQRHVTCRKQTGHGRETPPP